MTSADAPQLATPEFRVDYLSGTDLPFPGRLGMCRAPGTRGAAFQRSSAENLESDLLLLLREHGARTLVTLQEHSELKVLGIRDLFRLGGAAGLECLSFPIPDGFPPFSLTAAFALVDAILRRLSAGQTVVLHCYAGLGRTGTIAALVLAAQGMDPRQAIDRVRQIRAGAIPERLQEEFVCAFADAWSGVFEGEEPEERIVSMAH